MHITYSNAVCSRDAKQQRIMVSNITLKQLKQLSPVHRLNMSDVCNSGQSQRLLTLTELRILLSGFIRLFVCNSCCASKLLLE